MENCSLRRAKTSTNMTEKEKHLAITKRKEQMYMGTQVDNVFKRLVKQDDSLSHLTVTPRGVFGPDVYKTTSREYWDLTTKTDWARGTHQARYDRLFGNGTGIFW